MTAAGSEAVWTSTSPDQTAFLGTLIGRIAPGGLAIALAGPLGAGKTQLVKGIADGNDPARSAPVTSPTFTLIHEYPGRLILFHVDAYRLGGPKELEALGFSELIREDSVVVVEWADRVASSMPADTLWIRLRVTGASTRELRIAASGPLSESCFEQVQREVNP